MRIVIIEDSPADLRLFHEALRFYKITAEVHHFADGERAVEAIRAETEPWTPLPDLVFLDINLPIVGGFDVLRALREFPKYRAIPVAILTSSHAPEDLDMAVQLGADRFLVKPTTLRRFFEVVGSTVRAFSVARGSNA